MSDNKRTMKLTAAILVALVIYALPLPAGLSLNAWKLFSIFMGTITLVMLGVFPMGASSLMGVTAAVFFDTMSFESAFKGFISPITWLILSAFFISYGFVHTGLGKRIAYFFVSIFGSTPVGLAYGIGLTELLLAPGTPSATARTGGIIFPVVDSISRSFESFPNQDSRKKIGSFLIFCLFNFSVVTSAMFMTSMAANPFVAKLASNVSIDLSWLDWALYAIVPGLINLLLVPIILWRVMKPELTETRSAVTTAKSAIKDLGPMSSQEKLMAMGFILLMSLWLLGPVIKVSAAIAALLGLSFLLITRVVSWQQLLKQHSAFETFFWFGALLALAQGLSDTGFTHWFGESVAANMKNVWLPIGVTVLFLVYFYSHYFFASCTAHVGAMFLPFLSGAIMLGADAFYSSLAFIFASALFGSLTHYGIGPAPILFGSGYVNLKEWWKYGFIMSVANICIWAVVGGTWWWCLKNFF